MKKEIIDGNTACAKASYKLSEMSFIYPITPSSTMAEVCDELSVRGEKNIFGNVMDITEMQSEAGAIGAMHGALLSGSICTTFTSSQGLLLMLPNMYKIAGEMLPCVINVASRSVASHSLNIFCDHSDVMSTRQTGFAMLGSSNPQEVYDFTVASFLASIKSRVPFLHFFDGFRTSHQISTINTFDDEHEKLFPFDKYNEFKTRSLSPNSPKQYGTNESQDIFFQGREKSNNIYKNLPNILEETFSEIKNICGREYHIMEYYGSKNAKYVIVALNSACDTIKSFLDYEKNDEYGLLKINLYRPFDASYLTKILPASVEKIAVLDRAKEQGSLGEPLYLDVLGTINESDRTVKVVGGRYGLGGKEFSPNMVKSVYENLKSENPKNHFTIGIDDDLSNTSLTYDKKYSIESNSKNVLFYGLGSDGTVTSAKNITKIIGKYQNYVQAYFMYDSKKSGGLTRSYLSVSKTPIQMPYLTNQNDIVVCSHTSYLRKYNIAKDIKTNGILLINSSCNSAREFETLSLNSLKRDIAEKNIALYSIDANKIARQNNLQGKISSIMQMAFFKISQTLPYDLALSETAELIKKSLSKKGDETIKQNLNAIEHIDIFKIDVLSDWKNLKDDVITQSDDKYYNDYIKPIMDLNGDELPVSKVNLFGVNKTATSTLEKRNVANFIPKWISEKCIQCGKCTFVCPHAVLRAKLLSDEQLKNAPKSLDVKTSNIDKNANFHLEVSPADCLACGLCQNICPTVAIQLVDKNQNDLNGKTLFENEVENLNYTNDIENKIPSLPLSPLLTQYMKPYFEFSGACAGCGETPYIKLLSQLYGKDLIIANATGCSSIYGGSAPTCPYTKDKLGFGPAWANSLFEDNAEFGFGIEKSQNIRRLNFKNKLQSLLNELPKDIQETISNWLKNYDNRDICREIYIELKQIYQNEMHSQNNATKYLFENIDLITKKSVWMIGGDGWAYDIDAGGLDHIMQSNENVNILVLDTELYSNTGGQASKSTPRGAVAKFASNGKKTSKKNLALSALLSGNVYVAEVCLGADMNQTLKAFVEAEKYDGVSIIIAYAPCINHGIDMSKNIQTQIDAVKCGYWHLFRFNPDNIETGKNPMTIDSKEPITDFKEHLMNERRFANYFERTADNALFDEAKNDKMKFYETLKNIQKSFEK